MHGPAPQLSSATLDSLATFETSREDLEDGGDHEDGADHEPEETDESHDGKEPDHDNEFDYLMCEPI